MTHPLVSIVKALPSEAADELMLTMAAEEMKQRMATRRKAGRAGWLGSRCSTSDLYQRLLKNAAAGDMVDVMNLAGMIHTRRHVYGHEGGAVGVTVSSSSHIDVRQPPRMIRMRAAHGAPGGAIAMTGDVHQAVLLPQYGLMFSAETPSLASSHDDAERIARETKLFGYSDWRLPEATELALLIRRDRHSPAIDTEFFPRTPIDDWYWTATRHASDPGFAWYVYFSGGLVGSNRRCSSGFVRAVRSVPPSQ